MSVTTELQHEGGLLLATRTLNIFRNDSVKITNKMQPCNRIYYSTVHWRHNMFRAA